MIFAYSERDYDENDARTYDARKRCLGRQIVCDLRRDLCLISVLREFFPIRPFWMLILSSYVNLVYYTTPLRLHLHNAIFINSVDGTGSVFFLLWEMSQ